MARQITVDIVGDAGKFKQATEEAGKAGGHFGGLMSGLAAGLGLGLFNMAAGAVTNFTNQLGMAGQAFRDDQDSQQRMAVALHAAIPAWNGSTDAIEAYAASKARLGIQDDDIRAGITTFIGLTHNQTKAMQMQNAAIDLAARLHIPLADAVNLTTQAFNGHTRGLAAHGIVINKHHVGMAAIKDIQDKVKFSAEALANTQEGKLKAAQVKNAESWERIGNVVTQIQAVALPMLADAFSAVSTFVQDNVTPVVQQLTEYFQQHLWPALQQIWTVIMQVLTPALKFFADHWEAIKAVLIVVGIVIGVVVGIIVAVIAIVIAAVVLLAMAFLSNIKSIMDNWGKLVDFVKGLPAKISSAASGMWNGILNAFKGMLNAIIGMWNSLEFRFPGIAGVGAFDFKLPHIPTFHSGGLVPGSGNVLAMLQGGERVLSRSQASRGYDVGDIHIHVDQGAYIDGPSLDILAQKLVQRIKYAPGT